MESRSWDSLGAVTLRNYYKISIITPILPMKNWGLRRIKWLARGHTASKQQNRKFSPISRLQGLFPGPAPYVEYHCFSYLKPFSTFSSYFHFTFTSSFCTIVKSVSQHTPTSVASHIWSVQLDFHRAFFGYALPFPDSLRWTAFWNVFSLQTATQNLRNTSKSYRQLNFPHSPKLRLFFAKDLTLYLNVLIIYCDI